MAAIAIFSLLLLLSCSPVLGFTRSDFPPEFVFGAATSAYQVSCYRRLKFFSMNYISPNSCLESVV